MRARSAAFFSLYSSLALSAALLACSGDDSNPYPSPSGSDASTDGSAKPGADSGANDGSVSTDSSAPSDSGVSSDTGSASDTGTAGDTGSVSDAGPDRDAEGASSDAGDASLSANTQALVTSVGPGVTAIAVTINQGTAIGKGAGSTPATLAALAADPSNTQTIVSDVNPFVQTGHVPDTAAGFCNYPDGGAPTRATYATGAKFETSADAGDPMVPMAPFYFPFVYTRPSTPTPNAFGGMTPIIGLFDWRPKDIDEGLVAAESDDNGQTWYFMQTVLELNPDYTNESTSGYSPTSTNTGCPATITATNASTVSVNGATADDGWGHAAIVQLPGTETQLLYMLDRNTANMPGTQTPVVDNAPLHVISLTAASSKFPVWNTNSSEVGANDIRAIASALDNTPDSGTPVVVQDSVGLLNPDGILAVFPTAPGADAGAEVTVLYVQKIVGGDNTGATALPTAQQCTAAPVSKKVNHDISNVRIATTVDGVTFTDHGIVSGLNDPTTVDYTKTRWVSPRGTLIDIHGDGSRWGLYFSAGNCLDGDSDAFHFIGYAESTDKVSWTVYNDINHPIASINTITTANQAGGASVTIPATPPVFPTEPWFGERLYAPTAVQIDPTHLSMTFAGYGVQTPSADLLAYRQIGNVVLTVSQALPAGTPNNSNSH